MKMNNYGLTLKVWIAVFSVLLTFPLGVLGENSGIGTGLVSIGPRVVNYIPKDADNGQWCGGAQARLHLTPSLGLEGSIDYLRNDFGLTRIKTYPLQASLLAYIFPGAVISPFLLGGGGWYYTEVDGPFGFNQTTTRFGLHAGAGIEMMLNESLSLDGTYRYVWLESLTSKDENALNKTYQDSGSMITIALNFLF